MTAVLGAGIRAVLARSFSRTYYRNAVNNGLLPLICDTSRIREGDRLSLGQQVVNHTTGESIAAEPLPPIMLEIIQAGGLVPYFREHGDFVNPETSTMIVNAAHQVACATLVWCPQRIACDCPAPPLCRNACARPSPSRS